jgi:hypothetical protein
VSDAGELWRAFIEGPVYCSARIPWRDDPAFAVIREHAGLRESLGGHVGAALTLASGMVQATSQVDLVAIVQAQRPAYGLCLGFGMHALEPYELLQAFDLDAVHAYEWIAEHVVEAAQMLQSLCAQEPALPERIRLHHGTLSDLRVLDDGTIRVIYTGNVFNHEIPMTPATFDGAVREILRVLAPGGVVLIRGSAGVLETHLAPYGCLLLHTPLMAVFQKASH